MPIVDLFCGCGGLSKGFALAGFEIAAAYDGWQSAVTCYNANFNDHEAHLLDLSDVDAAVAAIREHHPTMIIGGPPCQEFSNAGKREEGERADLTYKYAQIITQIQPEYFVMENVPRVRSSKAYQKARALYVEHGYGLTELVLDASRCGAPQNRSRFICIGSRNEPDNFMLDELFRDYIGKPITVADYFEQKNIPLEINAYYRHPTTYTRRGIFSVNEVAPTIRGVNRPRPAQYNRNPNDAVPEEEVENTNRLTLQQRAIIQTFPQDYQFENLGITRGDLEQMVGNAVPVALAQFVAGHLYQHIANRQERDGDMETRNSFADWLRNEKHYTDRSISDVCSRLHRAERFLPDRPMDKYFMTDLEEVAAYKALKSDIKSQIKKAVNLKIAFDAQLNTNE